MLSFKLLGILGATALLLTVFAPVHYLILFDLTLLPVVGLWSVGGVRIDPSDVMILFIAIAVVLRQRSALRTRTPYFFTWLLLGILLSLSYLSGPEAARSGTDPIRIGYQLYRYCWKPILYYPICIVLLRNTKQVYLALAAAVVGADICAMIAVKQGYGHLPVVGPFNSKNGLAMAIEGPSIIALHGTLFPVSRAHFIFSGMSFVLLLRALFFSGSRGGMVAVVAAVFFFVGVAFLFPAGRRRLLQMIPLAAVAVALLFVMRPNLLERPSVKHATTVLTQGITTNTMQWRFRHRWPYFFNKALEHPFLGTGTATEEAFGESGNTPHNGYIAQAVKNGFPALAIFLLFFCRLVRDGLKSIRRSQVLHERLFGIALIAAVLSIMMHNIVDTSLTQPHVLKFFWLCCALGASTARFPKSANAATEDDLQQRLPMGHPAVPAAN